MSGHLCLYRNTVEINDLFYKTDQPENSALSYRYAFTSPFPCYFDEHLGMDRISNTVSWYDSFYENYMIDIYPGTYEFSTFTNKYPFIVEWKNKMILKKSIDSVSSKEFMYVHFQKRDLKVEKDTRFDIPIYITPNGISNDFKYLVTKTDKLRYIIIFKRNRIKRILKRIKQYSFLKYVKHIWYIKSI